MCPASFVFLFPDIYFSFTVFLGRGIDCLFVVGLSVHLSYYPSSTAVCRHVYLTLIKSDLYSKRECGSKEVKKYFFCGILVLRGTIVSRTKYY